MQVLEVRRGKKKEKKKEAPNRNTTRKCAPAVFLKSCFLPKLYSVVALIGNFFLIIAGVPISVLGNLSSRAGVPWSQRAEAIFGLKPWRKRGYGSCARMCVNEHVVCGGWLLTLKMRCVHPRPPDSQSFIRTRGTVCVERCCSLCRNPNLASPGVYVPTLKLAHPLKVWV